MLSMLLLCVLFSLGCERETPLPLAALKIQFGQFWCLAPVDRNVNTLAKDTPTNRSHTKKVSVHKKGDRSGINAWNIEHVGLARIFYSIFTSRTLLISWSHNKAMHRRGIFLDNNFWYVTCCTWELLC